MPIFTGTPVETVPASPFLWIHDPPNSTGGRSLFDYGGAIYIVGFEQDVSGGVVIAKSTDAGATWSYFFQGALFPPEQWTGFQDVVLDMANDQLIFLALESFVNGNIATFAFDLIGETFGPITYASAGIFNGTQPFCLVQRPSGDVLAIYSEALGSLRALNGMTITAGVFGTPFTIDAGSGSEKLKARAAISDSSGVIHIAYSDATSNLLYITLDASNTPGTRATISSGFNYLANAIISTTLDAICFDASQAAVKTLYIGTPVSAPVWTQYTVPAPGGSLVDDASCVIDNTSTLKFFFVRREFGVTWEVMQTEFNGSTLSTPVVYWDLLTNPPPGAVGLPVADINAAGITAWLNSGTVELGLTTVINGSNDYTACYVSTSGTPTEEGYQNKLY